MSSASHLGELVLCLVGENHAIDQKPSHIVHTNKEYALYMYVNILDIKTPKHVITWMLKFIYRYRNGMDTIIE